MTKEAILTAEAHLLEALREAGELAGWEIRDVCPAVAGFSDQELDTVVRYGIDANHIGTLWGDGTIYFIPLV